MKFLSYRIVWTNRLHIIRRPHIITRQLRKHENWITRYKETWGFYGI